MKYGLEVLYEHKVCYLFVVYLTTLYLLVNKANLVHNLFLVYLSISTCFGRLCAHHQEKQLCFCDTCYLLFCVDDCLLCRVDWKRMEEFQSTLHNKQSSIQHNKYQVSHRYSCFSWWWAHSRPKHVEKINTLKEIVHQVSFMYKIIQGCVDRVAQTV